MTSGGKKPPRPPAAPTMPVTLPTRSGGAMPATQANTPPVPRPRKNAISTNGDAGRAPRAAAAARRRPPGPRRRPARSPTTVRGPIRSDSMPPTGRAMTAAMAKPAVRVPAAGQVEVVDVLEVGRQVGREGDEAAEGDGVQEGHLPGHRQLQRPRPASGTTGSVFGCHSGESRIADQTGPRPRPAATAMIRWVARSRTSRRTAA